jgi:hypothetical protein
MEDSPCCYGTWGRRLVARFPCNLTSFSARSTLALKDLEPPRRAPHLSPEPSPRKPLSVAHRANRGDLRPGVRRVARIWCAIGYEASAERGWCVVRARNDFRRRQASVRIAETRAKPPANRRMRATCAPGRGTLTCPGVMTDPTVDPLRTMDFSLQIGANGGKGFGSLRPLRARVVAETVASFCAPVAP